MDGEKTWGEAAPSFGRWRETADLVERGGFSWRSAVVSATVVFVVGALLHFVFDWLGAWRPLALIAAVNESVWEHLKIAFWPGLAWAAIERRRCAPGAHWAAAGFGLFAAVAAIVAGFYGYVAVLGDHLLALDIGLFAIAILIGRIAALALPPLLTRAPLWRGIGLTLLVGQAVAFSLFTFAPPQAELFRDGRNGLYGLAAHEPR